MEFFKSTNIDFLGKKWYFLGFSLIFSIAGVLSIAFWHHIPLGVDFKGGTLVDVKFASAPDYNKVRRAVDDAGYHDAEIQRLGGEALFINNLEVRTPPVYLPFVENNLSFVLFHDAGNVFATPNDMTKGLTRFHQDTSQCTVGSTTCNFNYISQALGAGIRYKTPVGPVRFDLGYSLNPTIFPNFSQSVFVGTKQTSPFNLYFSIGQTF